MATLVKRKTSPYWYIQYRQGDRWNKRSTQIRHDDPEETRSAREECVRQTLKELGAARAPRHSRWADWVPDFFEQRYATMPKTKLRYLGAWRNWQVFLTQRKIGTPAQLRYEHLMEFLKWRQNPDVAGVYRCRRNTAIYEIKVLGTLLQEAVRRAFIVTNPARGLGLVKIRPRERPEITLAEERIIRQKLKDYPEWMRVSFDIAMATGCRLRETAVELKDVDFEKKLIHFPVKGGRIHTTILPPRLLPLLRRLKAEGRERACDLPGLPSKSWWKFFGKIGLPHLSFHSTRVAVVTRLARAGVPERHAMRFVGHASSTIHRVYTRLQVDDLTPCVKALERLGNPRHKVRKSTKTVVSGSRHLSRH
jgi:integrase